MKNNLDVQGIVLLCDVHGSVIQVLRDDIGVGSRFVIQKPLALGLERGSLHKALRFVEAIKTKKVIVDWQMAASTETDLLVLSFAGIRGCDKLLITASQKRRDTLHLLEYYAEAVGLNARTAKEHINRQLDRLEYAQDIDNALFDELGRLNNELITLQRELAKKNAELERLNEEKNHFLGIAAHDLRNPLNAIQMYSEFLMEEVANRLDEEHLEFITIIHNSSEFMLKLVNDLLDVARIESGKLYLELAPLDLVKLVEQNVAINRKLAAHKEIDIELVVREMSLLITADKSKLEQVLNNLIGNAVKFSEPNTRVTISLASHENEAIITVTDQGPGIPQEELTHIFKPFHRTSVRPSGDERSTGLGLAIVHRIVLGHKGRIWVESELAKGTTFYVALPLDLTRA